MAWMELTLAEQMNYAKANDVMDRISFSSYPVLPEVADFMINSGYKTGFSRICENLFRKSNSNIWSTTLAIAARKKVEFWGVDPEFDHALVNIALHLNTDVETLRYLYTLNDRHVNWGLANNPNTPKDILTELLKVKCFDIDDALLHNPNSPEEIKPTITARYPNGYFSVGYYYDYNNIKVVASGN